MMKSPFNNISDDIDLAFDKTKIFEVDAWEKWLDKFTTAPKNKSFNHIYIQASTDSNKDTLILEDAIKRAEGLVEWTLKITKLFDELFFIENDHEIYSILEEKLQDHDRCQVTSFDFDGVKTLKEKDWNNTCGVLVLNWPGMSVDQTTSPRKCR